MSLIATVIAAAGLLFSMSLAQAAAVTGLSDIQSTLDVSAGSNHEVKFVTPTGVDAPTDTITLTFGAASTYGLSSIAFGDLDIGVDASAPLNDCAGAFTNKTLATSPAAGTWGVGVSGQTITLTAPTDATSTEVVAGRCLRILIGTNASFPSAGTNQITNPSSVGTRALSLGGTFGDTGTATIFTVADGDIGVTATVASPGGGGGGGGGPPPPPTIFNIRTQSITETTASVLWDTDISSTSFVDYGPTVAYGSTTSVGGNTFNHSVPLTGLTAGQTYHFRVRSTGVGTTETVSGDNTFTTLDTTAPIISNVRTANVTGTSADILWDTNEDSDSRVNYGTTVSYGSTTSNGSLVNTHALSLAGLSPNTTHHYQVVSKDVSNNTATSADFTFSTLDTTPPAISAIIVDNITASSARVNWTTDELADSKVSYGLTVSYGAVASNGSLIANHQVDLTGLAASTLYHYIVTSKDGAGNSSTSTDQVFTTAPDTTPPANVSGFTAAPGNQLNALSWTNPVDADFAGVRIRRSTIGTPGGPAAGSAVYDGTGTSFLDTGLTNGTTYYYAAFAYDTSGNFATGAAASGRPFDTTPPGQPTGLVVTPGNALNQLAWSNPIDADFAAVTVRRSNITYPSGPTAGTEVYAGAGNAFTDTGLTNGSTYYYSIFARDTSDNWSSTAAQGTGTPTAPPPPPPGPVCGNSQCEAGEDTNNCSADCPAAPPPGPVCGNNQCEPPETNVSCAADCPAPPPPPPPPPGAVCGNNQCEAGESVTNCPVDCQAPVVTGGQPAAMDRSLVEYYALSRILRLHPDRSGILRSLSGSSFSVVIPEAAFNRPVRSITLDFDGRVYLFQKIDADGERVPEGGTSSWLLQTVYAAGPSTAYAADVSAPAASQQTSASFTVIYDDNASETVTFVLQTEGYGAVYESADGNQPVAGALVSLFRNEGGEWTLWNALPYQQTNPISTNAQGLYGFMVPPGQYQIEVVKDGYRKRTVPSFTVANEVVNDDIEIVVLPKTITELIIPGAPITENIFNVAKGLTAQTSYITKVVNTEVIHDPRVERTTQTVVAPAAVIVTATIVVRAAQFGTVANYLYFIVTQPILLIGRRKRKEFGTVYNALSKMPLDLAIVRQFRSNGRLVRTIVTDKQGRYAFLTEPGEYRIEASKPGYKFPTDYLKDQKEDGKYLDIYHGELIATGAEGALITANIPLDPIEETKTTKRILWESTLRKLQDAVAVSSIVISFLALLAYRTPLLIVMTVLQAALYFLFKRLARAPQPKTWGIVYDEATKKPLPFAVARIIETRYNKVLESRVTDARGRYNFLVGNNRYFVSVEKPGYEKALTNEIDLTKEATGGVIGVDVALKQKTEDQAAPPSAPPPPPPPPSPPGPEIHTPPAT